MDLTAQHVYKGLAGFFLIKDSQEAGLNLPSGNYDVPLVIQDRSLNADGSLNYSDGTGNTVLVNGAPMPYFQVAARKYRFRLLNGSNQTAYNFQLSNGQAMTEIGNEGGLLAAPVNRTSLPLSPAERADVVIDFSKVPVGTSVTMTDGGYGGSNYSGYSGGSYSSSSNGNIIRFDVVRSETDPSTVPATLRPITKLSTSSASITRTFTLDRGSNGWQINGQLYDPTKYLATVKAGATEIWKFQNNSGDDHPIHVHLVNFQVLDVNGKAPAAPDDSWKDTINVPGRGSATVIAKFDDYTGTFVLHCHRLEHEDRAMMGQFQVVP
jgi:FtsP/CotA-like multicopper oxidase with cupredoxin domain